MTAFTIRKIDRITEKELADIVGVCVRAYENETLAGHMVGGRDELRPLLFSAMMRAGDLDGALYVVEVDDRIVSLALWFKPGHKLWGSEEQRDLGYNQLMEALSDADRDWWKNTYAAQMRDFLKKTISVPLAEVWALNVLGTDPAYQRQGYGTSLMEYVQSKEMVSPTYAALCTTTKANAETQERFYNGLGYPTQGYFELPSRFGPCPIYSFVRDV